MLSCVRLFATPWTIAHQVPLSMEFSRQESWSGLPFPTPGDLPHPGTKPTSPASAVLAGRFFTTGTTGEVSISSVQFSSVTHSCPTLCDPMNPSTPGLLVHHQLLEFTQTHEVSIGAANRQISLQRASLLTQMVKNSPAMQETWFPSLGGEDRPEKVMVTHSNILAWRIPRTEETGGLQSMGSQNVGHDWATFTFLCKEINFFEVFWFAF